MKTVAKWDVLELAFPGKTGGNPFTDYTIRGIFSGKQEQVTADGFYDGEGMYRVRFMPSFEGEYAYRVEGSFCDEVMDGSFVVTAPRQGVHGPIRVNGFGFAYEDGIPYLPFGTTCYAWVHQEDELVEKTLETLADAPFNKIRFCIFPKHFIFNRAESVTYPYEGTPCSMEDFDYDLYGEAEKPRDEKLRQQNHFDLTRFNPMHFRRIEQAIVKLGEMGIEADLIVMHPYDRWGFSCMTWEQDDLYWRYVVARFAAYRNVWWSLANEWDFLPHKIVADWEHYASILVKRDPYRHLRSIHNGSRMYDHSRPWITHVSAQGQWDKVPELRMRFGKPVVADEIKYEGNIECRWGSISGLELIRRFWMVTVTGGWPGHGETFDRPDDILWWSHGGVLHGESPERIAFLRDIVNEMPGRQLEPVKMQYDDIVCRSTNGWDEAYLFWYGIYRPVRRRFNLPEGKKWRVMLIDTWSMTKEDLGEFSSNFPLNLPGREDMALLIMSE